MRAGLFVKLTIGVAVLIMAAPRLDACIGDRYNSIHFHSGVIDFGTVPRRGRVSQGSDRYLLDGTANAGQSGIELEVNPGYGDDWEQNRNHFLKIADDLFKQHKWTKSLSAFRYVSTRFGVRGVVNDRIEIIDNIIQSGRRMDAKLSKALNDYASAVPVLVDENHPSDSAIRTVEHLAEDPSIGFLRRHAMYQRACLAWEADHPEDASLWLQRFLDTYHSGSKREESLIMMARASVLSEDPSHRNVAACHAALDRLQREFPRSRFRRSALGLRGRCFYLTARYSSSLECYFAVGDMPSVELVAKEMPSTPKDYAARLLAGYLRRLAAASNSYRYEHAVEGIDRASKAFTPRDARIFSRILARDLTLPAPYFYYRLYHTLDYWKGLPQMARKAEEILAQHSAAALPPLIQVRFAEIYYQQKRYRLALEWSDRVLSGNLSPTRVLGEKPRESAARALYVRGAVLHKLKRFKPAIAAFNTLVNKYADSPLVHGAREELALLSEAVGDLDSALDQYFALGYQADIAYLLDARMPTDAVEKYVRRAKDGMYTNVTLPTWWHGKRRSDIPSRLSISNLLNYSLGIRYLRDEQWDRAVYWLRQVPRSDYIRFSQGRRDWDGANSPDPITAARELGYLHRTIQLARDDNSRASALFNYATYYYRHGSLLLYNPALWQEEREFSFQMYWNEKRATKADTRAVWVYMHQHEIYARTLKICEETARRYPNTAVAPQALYRAATAADKLSNFNEWWRDNDKGHNHELQASHLMKALAKRYPNSPLLKEANKFAVVFANEAQEAAKYR